MKSVTTDPPVFAALALVAALSGVVRAHGTVNIFTANDVAYAGPKSLDVDPPSLPDSPVRQIAALGPMFSTVTDLTSQDMACGPGAAASAPTVAAVTAGTNVTFHYRTGIDGVVWTHDVGPVMTYMYACPASADTCTPSGAGWFKIDEKGFIGASDAWYQEAYSHNRSLSVLVPAGVPDGDYLIRHEILALHVAQSTGGAEFYVSCTQVRVSGGGADAAAQAELVAFPGAYSADDPGILVDVYTDINANTYKFPGPAVFGATSAASASEHSASSLTSETPPSQALASSDAPASVKGQIACASRLKRRRARLQGRFNPALLRESGQR